MRGLLTLSSRSFMANRRAAVGKAPPSLAVKPDSKSATQAAKRKTGKRVSLNLIVAAICFVVMGAWALSQRRASLTDESLPTELRKLLRCGEICDLGISDKDRLFSEGVRKHTGAALDEDHTDDLIKVCMWRCQEGDKTTAETHGVASVEEYTETPAIFRNFVTNAKQCAGAGFRTASEIVTALEQCGVVHLENAVPGDILGQVQKACSSIRGNSQEDSRRTDFGNLRGGRLETWVPFQPPFNDTRLLQVPGVMSAIKSYLGPEAVLDHVSVITAAGKPAMDPQKLHADVGLVRQHLEVHIPLVDISAQMGPTVFCPASHGLAQKGRAGWTSGVERALSSWYLTPIARCGQDASISYAPPLKMGQMTIYDANVFHGGTANRAGVERPVLQLSYSMSPSATAERDYLKATFKANLEAKQLAIESSEGFRRAFASLE